MDWERLQLESLYDFQQAQPVVEDIEGTPLIIPRVAGIAHEEGWEEALAQALKQAELDFDLLQGQR